MDNLPMLDSVRSCPKCKQDFGDRIEDEPSINYISNDRVRIKGVLRTATGERMTRACPRCDYKWQEAPADAQVEPKCYFQSGCVDPEECRRSGSCKAP